MQMTCYYIYISDTVLSTPDIVNVLSFFGVFLYDINIKC